MSQAKVFVPATVGNIGPGFDVLGLALEGLGDVVSLKIINQPSRVISVTGKDADIIPLDPNENIAVIAALAFLERKGIKDKGVELSIDRQLPVSGGLGSSAAASVGGALAAAWALEYDSEFKKDDHQGHVKTMPSFSDLDILESALFGESKVSGRHLDNIAPCLYGGITLIQSVSPPTVKSLPIGAPLYVSVVSPRIQLTTKQARAVLPPNLATSDWTKQMAYGIGLAVGFAQGDYQLIRDSLHDIFAEPARMPFIDRFLFVKEAALGSGALGCSISGAGPSIFAIAPSLVDAQRVGQAMSQAFLPIRSELIVSPIATKGAHLV